jgi:NDP-sugar pyrophosphorylase family protein
VRAKAAVPIAGQPLISRILRWLAGNDVRQLVLNLHHLPETITSQVGDGSDLGVRVRYSWESPVLGSAGGPRKALPLLGDKDFFIINGDTLADVDLQALAENHRQTGALVTIAVVPNQWPERYSGLAVDSVGRFHGVVPRGSHVRSYHVVGVQIAHPSAFERLAPNEPAEIFGGLYGALVKQNPGHVRAFPCSTDFWDVGTPADYLETALAIGRKEGVPSAQVGRGSRVDPSAQLTESVVWEDAEIGARALLERCVVADRVKIPSGSRFRNCAIIQADSELVVADISNG